jgi:hypothetical protein
MAEECIHAYSFVQGVGRDPVASYKPPAQAGGSRCAWIPSLALRAFIGRGHCVLPDKGSRRVIQAPGARRGIAHLRTRDPVACAQGFYWTGVIRE